MENRLTFSGGIFARDHKFAQSVRKHHKSQTSRKKILSTFQNNNLKTKHHNNGLALPASTYLDSAVTLGQRRKEVEKACCSLASVFFPQEKKPSLSGPFHVKLFSGWQIATGGWNGTFANMATCPLRLSAVSLASIGKAPRYLKLECAKHQAFHGISANTSNNTAKVEGSK